MIKMEGKNVSDWIQKWEAKTGESLDLGYRVAVSFICSITQLQQNLR